MQCRQCKYFKSFKYTYGCDKFRKVIVNPDEHKECFENNNNTFMNFFDDILSGKKNF